jgi:hypothetical protein
VGVCVCVCVRVCVCACVCVRACVCVSILEPFEDKLLNKDHYHGEKKDSLYKRKKKWKNILIEMM